MCPPASTEPTTAPVEADFVQVNASAPSAPEVAQAKAAAEGKAPAGPYGNRYADFLSNVREKTAGEG